MLLPWHWWIIASLVWFAMWLFLGARRTATMTGDGVIRVLRTILPAFCVSTFLLAFVAVPTRGSLFQQIMLWIHHASFALLFLFLVAAQYLQTEAWWKIRKSLPARSVVETYDRLWLLAELIPAPAALGILLTGLRLIWESPELNSVSNLWLLLLISGFSIFFWDGIFGYLPIVRGFRKEWVETAAREAAGQFARRPQARPWENLELLCHFLSFPILFVVGTFRWSARNPVTQAVADVERRLRFLPTGWPEVTTAVSIWASVGITMVLIKSLINVPRRKAGTTKSTSSTETAG